MKFKMLSGDINWQEYGGKFVSKKLNNGDWDYWLVINCINMWKATGEETPFKYTVEIQAVSPQAAWKLNLDRALDSCGFSDEETEKCRNTELIKVEVLSDYGIFATLWHKDGNNIKSLLKDAHKEVGLIQMLFGFYMDRTENRIGQDGWDFISGQDIREFFEKMKED